MQVFAPRRIGMIIAGLEVPHCHLHLVPINVEAELVVQPLTTIPIRRRSMTPPTACGTACGTWATETGRRGREPLPTDFRAPAPRQLSLARIAVAAMRSQPPDALLGDGVQLLGCGVEPAVGGQHRRQLAPVGDGGARYQHPHLRPQRPGPVAAPTNDRWRLVSILAIVARPDRLEEGLEPGLGAVELGEQRLAASPVELHPVERIDEHVVVLGVTHEEVPGHAHALDRYVEPSANLQHDD